MMSLNLLYMLYSILNVQSALLTCILPSTKMTKAVGHSEKEVVTWKAKYHKCNESLVEMVERVSSQCNIQHVM